MKALNGLLRCLEDTRVLVLLGMVLTMLGIYIIAYLGLAPVSNVMHGQNVQVRQLTGCSSLHESQWPTNNWRQININGVNGTEALQILSAAMWDQD